MNEEKINEMSKVQNILAWEKRKDITLIINAIQDHLLLPLPVSMMDSGHLHAYEVVYLF